MNRISSVSFCGTGSESAGSISYNNAMRAHNNTAFRGGGSESSGSMAENPTPVTCPNCDQVSFQASANYEKKKKGVSALGILAGAAVLTAATIVGLGYAHKTNVLSKMNDGKMKEIISKADPACKKCHEWCSSVKTKGTELWGKVKNLFSPKKS